MRYRWIFHVILFWFLHYVLGGMNSRAGPFDLMFQGGGRCPGYENDEYQFTYKLKKINRTAWAIDVEVSLTSALTDNDKLTLILDQKANNQWKENYFRKDFDHICTMMELFFPEQSARIHKVLGIKGCPIKPGNYSAKNFVLTWNVNAIPMFFYNSYRMRMSSYSKEGKRKFCVVAFIDIVPKRTKG